MHPHSDCGNVSTDNLEINLGLTDNVIQFDEFKELSPHPSRILKQIKKNLRPGAFALQKGIETSKKIRTQQNLKAASKSKQLCQPTNIHTNSLQLEIIPKTLLK